MKGHTYFILKYFKEGADIRKKGMNLDQYLLQEILYRNLYFVYILLSLIFFKKSGCKGGRFHVL